MTRRAPFRVSIALAFLLALVAGQQAALVHQLGHAAMELADHGIPPGERDCPDHGLYAPFAGSMCATAVAAPLVFVASAPLPGAAGTSASLPPRYTFLSRAPPRDLA